MTPLTVIIREEGDAWWTKALPANSIRKATSEEIPAPFELGYRMQVPLIETPLYLPYLLQVFQQGGGLIVNKKIDDINGLLINELAVINCTGLGAADLVGDDSLYPILGQILKADPMDGIEAMSADFTFGAAGEELAYIIPRRDCTVLGGTARKDKYELTPQESVSEGILERCSMLSPLVPHARVQTAVVGLRPGRPEIRLEREGKLIHNYGHGGGGYTVAWGCAYEVRDLLNDLSR
ncbi:MAG: FAD-binding oxidoreductase [Saprospirales bacterium]|nr:FAD-binding oxidoreductase [Saprospirales bacterium]